MIKETKVCSKCGIEKKFDEYRIRTVKGKQYLRSACKKCELLMVKKYYNSHKKERAEYSKKYYIENKEYYSLRSKIYRKNNIENLLKKEAIYRKENKEKRNEYNRNYYQKNKKELRKKSYLRYKRRKGNDNLYKLKDQTRRMIKDAFRRKKYKKNGKTEKILGCNYYNFIKHLLQTFKNNYGYDWDGKEKIAIDHIIPISKAKTEDEVIKLCHYTNLQLLKYKDNLYKSDKMDWRLENVK